MSGRFNGYDTMGLDPEDLTQMDGVMGGGNALLDMDLVQDIGIHMGFSSQGANMHGDVMSMNVTQSLDDLIKQNAILLQNGQDMSQRRYSGIDQNSLGRSMDFNNSASFDNVSFGIDLQPRIQQGGPTQTASRLQPQISPQSAMSRKPTLMANMSTLDTSYNAPFGSDMSGVTQFQTANSGLLGMNLPGDGAFNKMSMPLIQADMIAINQMNMYNPAHSFQTEVMATPMRTGLQSDVMHRSSIQNSEGDIRSGSTNVADMGKIFNSSFGVNDNEGQGRVNNDSTRRRSSEVSSTSKPKQRNLSSISPHPIQVVPAQVMTQLSPLESQFLLQSQVSPRNQSLNGLSPRQQADAMIRDGNVMQQTPTSQITSKPNVRGNVHQDVNTFVKTSDPCNPDRHNINGPVVPWETPEGGWPSSMSGKPHTISSYKNAYSSTGFDMLQVLMRIVTRPNPEINLGIVDLSCAFVVCDADQYDCPIVYCSENFERLTGYTKHMILGRNCRFLQAPDGSVESGIARKYTDDDSVSYLREMIRLEREAQISMINYRRGGQPFMNLLTTIPITWDSDRIKYYVGFQVDLVEQPNAVTSRNTDGSFAINYQRAVNMPRYVINAPDSSVKAAYSQAISKEDVTAMLGSVGVSESDFQKRIWHKVMLDNTDDVIYVLSLKGLFQWVSPSCEKVLEYEQNELIGTALSSVCHPSDIVPVTRELKDTSSGHAVSVVFRIRRKKSGYIWFEGHGSLHTEQGKGRKSIILVGRERPVYALSKADVVEYGVSDHELWTKMSTSGMFLFVSSNVKQLLDRQPEELVGTSIQSLMRSESRKEFGRVLELTRVGKKAAVKHEVMNRRGQVLQAFTTLFPGDAKEGNKPTFLVAQTRLVRFSRTSMVTKAPPSLPKNEKSESDYSATSTNHPHSLSTAPSNLSSSTGGFMLADSAMQIFSDRDETPQPKQDAAFGLDDDLFDELKTTKPSSWQYEIRQLERKNRILAEEVLTLNNAKKKRKRRKGAGMLQKDCVNCHTRDTPEWRRGPSGKRDLCNSCGLRWAKQQQNERMSNYATSIHSKQSNDIASDNASHASLASASPRHSIMRLDDGFNSLDQITSGVDDDASPVRNIAHATGQLDSTDQFGSTVFMNYDAGQDMLVKEE